MPQLLHLAACPWWDPARILTERCNCPRPWRIRRNRKPRSEFESSYPWLIERRMRDDSYHVMLRAQSQQRALELIASIPDHI